MMARIIFLIALIGAYLALGGWPPGSGAWIRAMLALASMMAGIGAISLLASTSRVRRFKCIRPPGALERWTSGVGIVLALGLVYFILVFAPEKTREFSEYLHGALGNLLAGSDGPAAVDADREPDQRNNGFEISTLYDPDGVAVPKAARFLASEEPHVSLRAQGPDAARQLRDSGPIYLHAFSHQSFDGERWFTRDSAGPQKITCSPDGLIHLQQADQSPVIPYTILPYRYHEANNTLSTLHGVRFVKLPELVQLNSGTWLLPAQDSTSGRLYEYEAGSSPQRFEDLLASGAPIEPGAQDPIYLAPTTDAGLKLQIEQLSARFRNDDALGKRLLDLQHWMSSSFTYSRQVDYPDNGKPALENFLTKPECNEGFCVHFASAAVLMLRSVGIPSRISYGWMGGEFYEEHNEFVFRGAHGHAWAEMYLKDHGWVVFDTTPLSALPRSDAAPAGAVPPSPELLAAQETESSGSSNTVIPWKWMLGSLGAGVVLLFMLLWLKQGRPLHVGLNHPTDALGTAPEYLLLFHLACSRLGHPKPAGCTLFQYLKQLDEAGLAIPFAEELLTYHYNVAYRGIARDARCEKRLCDQIKDLPPVVLKIPHVESA